MPTIEPTNKMFRAVYEQHALFLKELERLVGISGVATIYGGTLKSTFYPKQHGKTTMPHIKPYARKMAATAGYSTSTKIARLTNINNQELIKLETPYKKEFIAKFKASIPSTKRSYVDTDKFWIVHYDQLKFLLHLCNEHFDDVLLFGFPKEITDGEDCFGILYLTETAPKEVIKATYKALAMMYHPDRPSGDSDKMASLNQAYQKCLEIRKSKTTDWDF